MKAAAYDENDPPRVPLSEAAAAHAYIESRRAVGRVLLLP